jgi:DNA polymerase-3 subunit delta'
MSFKSIKGQDKAINVLRAYVRNASLEGGYIFTGAQGIGKKMTALALAKELNCLDSDADACAPCYSCLKINSSQHPDVHIISEDEAQIKIESVRILQKNMSLRAYEGKYKVFIIDNAHTLTAEASNCLLKVLEEPAKNSLIILVSDKPNLFFKTVLSRCKIVKFSALKREDLEGILKRDYNIEDGFAHFLAYFTEGRLGLALKLKDDGILVKKNSIIDKFVLSPKPNAQSAAGNSREDVRGALNLLSSWFRDIYILKVGMPKNEVINSDRLPDLLRSTSRFSCTELDMILNNISVSISWLDKNVNNRLLMYNLGIELWKA